jgi:hypothetical protein
MVDLLESCTELELGQPVNCPQWVELTLHVTIQSSDEGRYAGLPSERVGSEAKKAVGSPECSILQLRALSGEIALLFNPTTPLTPRTSSFPKYPAFLRNEAETHQLLLRSLDDAQAQGT